MKKHAQRGETVQCLGRSGYFGREEGRAFCGGEVGELRIRQGSNLVAALLASYDFLCENGSDRLKSKPAILKVKVCAQW